MGTKKTVGFALVGCGRIAQKHAEILGGGLVPNAKLVAVCDIAIDRAEVYAKKYGVPAFADFHAMAKAMSNEIDVFNILTPSGSHAEHCIALAPYRKHIVVEKPMALRMADADAMIAACDAAGVRLFVVKQNRYNLPVVKMREALKEGRFGKLVLGTVRVRWCRKQEYYDQDPWRGTWAQDGGVFANQASHHVDLLEWMMGDVESVFAKSSTSLVKIEAEDTGLAVLKFKNGALGIIEATTATRPKDLEGSISLLGEKGTVEIGGFAVNEMRTWSFSNPEPSDENVVAHFRQNPPSVYGFGHVKYLENVVDCIARGKEALVNGREGRRSLELINALYQSIETGREVFLDRGPFTSKLGAK